MKQRKKLRGKRKKECENVKATWKSEIVKSGIVSLWCSTIPKTKVEESHFRVKDAFAGRGFSRLFSWVPDSYHTG